MTGITREEVLQVAKLSRIELSEEEIEKFTVQLASILEFFKQLQKADTSGIEPMLTAAAEGNVFREDSPGESLSSADALKNAPMKSYGMFAVPQVIDDGGSKA